MASISVTSMASEKSRSAVRQRVVLAATIGNKLEWYDFLIYAELFPTHLRSTAVLLK